MIDRFVVPDSTGDSDDLRLAPARWRVIIGGSSYKYLARQSHVLWGTYSAL